MSDRERAEAAAQVLADAINGLAAELTGTDEGEVLVEMHLTSSGGLRTFTWDWWWRPKGSARTTAGLAGAPQPPAQT